MSGPEHYREAERIAAACKSHSRADEEGFTGWARSDLADLAQVHATLALAAATADDRVRISHGDGTEYDVAVSGPAPSWAEVTA